MRHFTVILSVVACFIISCGNEDDCIDRSRVKKVACPAVYLPVCGCNGRTYGNSCEAEGAGVRSWRNGPCDSL